MSRSSTLSSKLLAAATLIACLAIVVRPSSPDQETTAETGIQRANAYAANVQPATCEITKRNPGHYISMRNPDGTDMIPELALPGVVGVQKRYYWKVLEPEQGEYDFSLIRQDLDAAQEAGLKLVVFVGDKTFNGQVPTPKYLEEEYTVKNRNRGYIALRWKPFVEERFVALLQAIGSEFDCDPAFEGIAIQESSLSLGDMPLMQHGYSPELYRDNLIAVLRAAAAAMPSSNVFWYMNYLPKGQKYLSVVAESVLDAGVAIGGPDVLPDNKSLVRMTYPLYDELDGRATLFNSMQNDSYAHERAGDGEGKYWTLEEMFLFARDQLHVDYVFWNRKNWRKPEDSFSFNEATPVIEKYADFFPDAETATE